MFGKLRDKLKGALKSLTGKAKEDEVEILDEDSPEEQEPEEQSEARQEASEKPRKIPKDKIKPKELARKAEEAPEPIPKKIESKAEEKPPRQKPEEELGKRKEEKHVPEPKQDTTEKKGFFTKLSEKITTVQLSEDKFEDLFWDLELVLLEANVAVSVIEKIKKDLKEELTTGRTARGNVEERILRRLEQTLRDVLDIPPLNLLDDTKQHHPLIIALVGVNGSGKTTTIAKLAKYFQDHKHSVVLAACDTFRAAAIQQLEVHAKALGLPLIKQDYGADPAAVAYDAVQHANAKKIDVVLLDTAGRLHSNTNLMDELQKLVRVAKPQRIIFIGEAVTGNDCVEQAQEFGKQFSLDGVILSKADVDEKGGAAVSISYVTGAPIIFFGTGQRYEDLAPFSIDEAVRSVLPA